MNLSAPFIERPVATTLLTIAVCITGAIAFVVLPVAPLPQVDFPTISVSAGLPGASAQIMASSVATPLERQFGHIAGITEMTSSSSLGSSSVTLQFDLSRNIDAAARDVEAGINAARTYLPADLITNDQISKAAQYRPLIVGYHNGLAVHLSDVANVQDSAQSIRTAGYLHGIPSVTVLIFRQPGANIIQTNNRIRAQLPFLAAVMPQGIKTTVVLDRTTTIKASLHDVESSLITSVVLVILVVFLFLRNGRATLIPSVAVPVSLIGTFAVMYLLGYSLDNLSLMALTISTGFVVDDAIVVMENISRYLEQGMDPTEAALKGAKEIGFTVLTMSTSLIAVFIPLLMMGGIVGRLFREFAVTLSTAIIVSMLLSLTTTPMMCAHLLKAHTGQKHGALYRASERFFEGMLNIYRQSLLWVLDNSGLMLVVLLLTIALNVVLVIKIPKGFFPHQDTGRLAGGGQGPRG